MADIKELALTTLEQLTLALDDAQERLSLALEASEVGVWEWYIKVDAAGNYTGDLTWDARMVELFKPPQRTNNFEMFEDCVIEEDLTQVYSAIEKSIETGCKYDYCFRLKTVPGRVIRGIGKCYYDKQAQPIKLIGVCIADTEHKNAPTT